MDLSALLDNFGHPAILFFFLGVLAVFVKSDLEIPPQIGKFLGIYLLFHIGVKGGWELYYGGFAAQVLIVMAVCVLSSFFMPFAAFQVLRRRLSPPDAGAVAATYGSISAVTFVTAVSFLDSQGVEFGGYMVAGMALMESPAIIAGLILIRLNTPASDSDGAAPSSTGVSQVIKESLFNGSVLLLLGSMVIGYASGAKGEAQLATFVDDIFYGMLSIYMLDMGLLAGRRLSDLKQSGAFVVSFALVFPLLAAAFGLLLCYLLGYAPGDALLQTVLLASASYIAVPAAIRIAVPQANMGILLPMSLGVTFTFNIAIGIPLYYFVIEMVW